MLRKLGQSCATARLFVLFFCAALTLSIVGGVHAHASQTKSANAAVIVAKGISLAGDTERTRLVIDLSSHTDVTSFLLTEPYRIVVDMGPVSFDAASKPDAVGLVSDARFGAMSADHARIVLDLASPALIERQFLLPAVGNEAYKLVLDLVAADATQFAQAMERMRGKQRAARKEDRRIVAAKRSTIKPVIVLDPGHGGIDSGAVGQKGTEEKQIVLTFAKELFEALKKDDRYIVHMTRDNDVFVPLRQRVRIARDHHADLFLSIHADSIRGHSEVRGASVYTLSERASDAVSAQLAANENQSDVLAGVDQDMVADNTIANILVDLTRRETKAFSRQFAEDLVGSLSTGMTLVRNPHRSAAFRVLKAPDVPSALLELGFLSNRKDETQLRSKEWRERTVNVVKRGIDRFFERRVAQAPY